VQNSPTCDGISSGARAELPDDEAGVATMSEHLPPMDSRSLVPTWLQRLAAYGWRVLVVIAMAVVLVQVAGALAVVTTSILVALIVAATFVPAVRTLREAGWGRTKAAAGVTLVALVVITGVFVLLAVVFAPYIADVVAALRAGGDAVQDFLVQSGVPPETAALVGQLIEDARSVLAAVATQLVEPVAALVTALILGGFLTFFLLQDGDRAWDWLVEPIRGWRGDAITESGRVALGRVGGYLRGTAILAGTDAISDFVFLVILGVPLAGPLAVLVFLGGFIPYLGGFVTTSVLVLVTLSTNGPTDVLILLLLIGIMNLIQGNVLAPMIYGKTVEVHPALVLIALPTGAALFGVIGLFAALPVVAFAMAIAPALVYALDRGPEGHSRPDDPVPAWLDRLAQWSWRGLIAAGLLGVAVLAATTIPLVVIPVVLAVVLAATLDPATAALTRRGWSRGRAALGVTAGTVIGIVGIVIATIAMMVGPLVEMIDTATEGASQGFLGDIGIADVVRALGSGLLASVAGALSSLASLAVILLLATLLTFYFLRDGASLWGRVLARMTGRRHDEMETAGRQAAGVLGGYMIGTGAISIFGAATTAILMIILGLPLALPIAVLSFFLGFIPYIGGFVSTALAFLVAVAVGESSDIVIMAIFTIVFNIAQGNFVAPLVYGKAVNLHPAVILLAIPAGSAVAGIIGMFLVVPFLGMIAVTWRVVLRVFDMDQPEVDGGALPADAGPMPGLSSQG
jgi:predicted PurR-regulated permease PerM